MRSICFAAGILAMTFAAMAQSPLPLRVACVGDSITFGDQIADRARDSYPALLERLSGERLVAGNFGVNGATALRVPGRAWLDTVAAREAAAFAPDAVVVMLGINDLAVGDLHGRYPEDLGEVVSRFQALPSSPRLFLCTLTPIAPAEHQAHANRLIRDTMNPAIRSVAAHTGARVVDVAGAFPNRLDLLPDGLHPNPAGAEIIARAVLGAILDEFGTSRSIPPAPIAGPPDLSIRNEALAALDRADLWLAAREAPADLPHPAARWNAAELRAPEDVGPLLALLDGVVPEEEREVELAQAALADALDRIGHETVFLGARPVRWREALLHQIVQRQRIDPRGGGYWAGAPGEADAELAALRATLYARQAIARALRPAP